MEALGPGDVEEKLRSSKADSWRGGGGRCGGVGAGRGAKILQRLPKRLNASPSPTLTFHV